MGIGKSLKKFVKKALPVAAAVAPFIPGMQAFAPILGAAAGGMKGGLKGALLGGIGGFAAGKFGQGFGAGFGGSSLGSSLHGVGAGQGAGFLSKLGAGLKGGLGSLAKGFGMPTGGGGGISDFAQNIFSGAPSNQGFVPGQPLPAGQEFLVKTTGGDSDSYFATADKIIQGVNQGSIDPTDIMTKDGNSVSFSNILGMYQQGQGQGGGGLMSNLFNFAKNNPNLLYGVGAGVAQHLENEANPHLDLPLLEAKKMEFGGPDQGSAVAAPVLTADFAANGGRMGYESGDLVGSVADLLDDRTYKQYEAMDKSGVIDMYLSAEEKAKYEASKKAREKVDTKARGGIIGLANGGEPTHEMDLRGGGFIPVGAYERADDVPARVSKNEFVMTADAVRAAGGGSIDRGSQRMYDLMNSLEARA